MDAEKQTLGAALSAHFGSPPEWCIVAGSGLSSIADALTFPRTISYDQLPHLPCPGVSGHAGMVLRGELHGQPIAVFCGRSHFYEGLNATSTLAMIHGIAEWGCAKVLLTNAAGALNPQYRAGDLMLIHEHINRIPAQLYSRALASDHLLHTSPYDETLLAHAREAALRRGLNIFQGVYAANYGPSYETPAEAAMLRALGADAVGMSTVPEALLAHHLGVRVLAISCISNSLVHKAQSSTTHEEVLANSLLSVRRLIAFLRAIIEDGV